MRHFIHIPKTGGTSLINDPKLDISYATEKDVKQSTLDGIDQYLNRYRSKPFGWMPEEKVFAHARYLDLSITPEKCFTVIRNPWDRMASKWRYSLELVEEYKIPYDIGTLEEFVSRQSLFQYKYPDFTWFTTIENWWDQVNHILDHEGNIVTDNLRFEYFNQDVEKYLGKQPLFLRRSKLKTQDYKKYYNPKTIQLVADLYKRDIETFDYDFDTSARKNYWNDN